MSRKLCSGGFWVSRPKHQRVQESLGLLLLKQEKMVQAEAILEKALESKPNSPNVLNGLGIIKDMQAKHKEAQDHFTAALFLEPKSAKINNNLGYSYYLAGDLENAEIFFQQSVQFDPEYVRAWSNLGLTYTRLNRVSDAKAALNKVGSEHQTANNIGYIGLLNNDRELAARELNRAIQIAPAYYDIANANKNSLNQIDTHVNSSAENQLLSKRNRVSKSGNDRQGSDIENTDSTRLVLGAPISVASANVQNRPSPGVASEKAKPSKRK